jgi:hypothetical protein
MADTIEDRLDNAKLRLQTKRRPEWPHRRFHCWIQAHLTTALRRKDTPTASGALRPGRKMSCPVGVVRSRCRWPVLRVEGHTSGRARITAARPAIRTGGTDRDPRYAMGRAGRCSRRSPSWCSIRRRAGEGEVGRVSIVMGLDQHRAQITAGWIDTETGEVGGSRASRGAGGDQRAAGTQTPRED